METVIVDTGPIIALLNAGEREHQWAREEFAQRSGPLLTCEAVLTEACFIASRSNFDPAQVLRLIEQGVLKIGMSLAEEMPAVRKLLERYRSVPASLADACLIRMSELYEPCRVMTFDGDFQVYRRHGRQVIPLLMP